MLALLGWIFSKSLGGDESTVAIVVMATMLLLGIVTWEDVVKNKGGWNTLIWYGGIIGLSSLLSKVKFFEWLAEVFKNNLAFDGHGNVAFFVIISSASSCVISSLLVVPISLPCYRYLPCWRMSPAHP